MKPLSLVSSLIFVIVCTLGTLGARADEVAIPAGKQAAEKATLSRPKAGMTAQKVEEKFGAPVSKSDPVGKPPISKWEYNDYFVYFESDRVISTVLKPAAAEAPAAVAPAPVEATPIANPQIANPQITNPPTEAPAPAPTSP